MIFWNSGSKMTMSSGLTMPQPMGVICVNMVEVEVRTLSNCEIRVVKEEYLVIILG